MHPAIPTTYAEAQRLTAGEIAEHLAWCDALDHSAADARRKAEIEAAMAAAARRAGG